MRKVRILVLIFWLFSIKSIHLGHMSKSTVMSTDPPILFEEENRYYYV